MAKTLKIGDKVKVFDNRLYKNDIATPLSVTMKDATVLKLWVDKEGRDLVDVSFHHDKRISHGHFKWAIDIP